MKKVINLYKPLSYTPLEVVEELRNTKKEYKDARLGYAGRLDPMAHGVLLVLCGDENLRRREYEKLSKEYVFEILFGVSTDSYDVMGRISEVKNTEIDFGVLEERMLGFEGEWVQEYPPFSSVPVDGKPLYWWARAGRIDEIKMPAKKVNVKKVKIDARSKISAEEVADNAVVRIGRVCGKFRQKQIIDGWLYFRKKYAGVEFWVVRARIECSAGLYVRGLAQELGRRMGAPTLAFSILRTRVGVYDLESSIKLNNIKHYE